VLDAACELGDGERSGLDYKELPRDVEAGAVLLLDDGKIVLDVTDVRGEECTPWCATAACSPTTRASTARAAASPRRRSPRRTWRTSGPRQDPGRLPRGVVSQERRRHVHGARADARRGRQGVPDREDRARRGGGEAALLDIMRGSDGIMVARGDLAVEVGDASVPALQKKMIRLRASRTSSPSPPRR
jgi:pyruvate kinase